MRTPQLILFCQAQADLFLKKAQYDVSERNQAFFNSKAETFKKFAAALTDPTMRNSHQSFSEYVKALEAAAELDQDSKADDDVIGFDSCNGIITACYEVRKVW